MLNFMTALEYRTRFEELSKTFNMRSDKVKSDISTVEWFIENGHRSNSLRNGFEEAMRIAKTIKDYSDECSEKIREWESV